MTTMYMLFFPVGLWCDLFQFTVHVTHTVRHTRDLHLCISFTFFSLSLSLCGAVTFQSAGALWWHLCEWGLRGWDSQWCFNDRPVIAVMCGAHSQQGGCGCFTEGFKVKKLLYHVSTGQKSNSRPDKCLFPWLKSCPYDLLKVTENIWTVLSPYSILTKGHSGILPWVIEIHVFVWAVHLLRSALVGTVTMA